MKLSSLLTASSLLIAAAMPSFAQTAAPATPAAPAPATTPAATPAATYANVPAVQQVSTQLTAQGYAVTNVTKAVNGTYTINAVSPTGVARTVTVNAATGAVTDTLNGGVANGNDDNGNDSDNGNDHDNGNDNNGGHDNGGNDGGSDD